MACLIVFLSIGAIRAEQRENGRPECPLCQGEGGWLEVAVRRKNHVRLARLSKIRLSRRMLGHNGRHPEACEAKDANREECGDIVTAQQYDNFEFQLDWKIEPGGNSGVKYLVVEDRPANWEQAYLDYHLLSLKKSGKTEPPDRLKPERWKYMSMSFELQLIDDTQNADARSSPDRITGALYDLMAPTQRSVVSLTDFNTARIVVQGKHVEHWINGAKVVQFERESPELQTLIVASKFKHLDKFGTFVKGHIALQDHNSEVWFRNIKIRELKHS